jgi:hypothetical protein
MKAYQRVGNKTVRPLMFSGEHSAFDLAQMFYAHHPDLDFANDLIDYCRNGFVLVHNDMFALAKPIVHPDDDKRRGWFIRYAGGNMQKLLAYLPCKLDFIAFCRENDGNLRIVEWDAFMIRAFRKVIKCGNQNVG